MPKPVKNPWYFSAGLIALGALAAHEALGALHFVSWAMTAPREADGPIALAFTLWNSVAALLLVLAGLFLAASLMRQAPALAGGATILALLSTLPPALLSGLHQKPVLATIQITVFAAMALCGLGGLQRDRRVGGDAL